MVLSNNWCTVSISIDEMYTLNSADNKHYDIVYNPLGLTRNDYYKVFSVEICTEKTTCIALISDYLIFDSDGCAILENDILTILQGNAISQINIKNTELLNTTELDTFGCNFAIYKVYKGYIIYGELEIVMLDFEFKTKWTFSGKDIFVSMSGRNAFEITDNIIKLYDFLDNYYKLDFDGNLLNRCVQNSQK